MEALIVLFSFIAAMALLGNPPEDTQAGIIPVLCFVPFVLIAYYIIGEIKHWRRR